jgi:precorrin-2 dehydrogenase/sirohydrochlorin ferrochelatase
VRYYPVFLNLNGRNAVVIGGGKVAERKVHSLIKTGAVVSVISPEITKNLENLRTKGLIRHVKRQYQKGDLKNAFIVIAGTSSSRINKKIARDAKQLINVIDEPSEGNFIAPSVVKRSPLTIAISTEGTSPAVAKFIRKEMEELYGAEFTRYLQFLRKIRKKAMHEIHDKRTRETFLKGLASEKILKAVRSKKTAQIFALIKKELLKKSALF